MKSLMELWKALAEDFSAIDGVSTDRDYKTVTDRVESEGWSFMAISLPNFDSDFLRCLDQGAVGSGHFLGFKRKGGLPLFLGGFLRRIFDSQSGKLLEDPCINSILAIRYLTGLFKKMEMDCSPARVRAAYDAYLECEGELKQVDRAWTPDDLREFSRMSALLFGDTFDAVNREVDNFEILPKHGPGSTADRLVGNQKWRFAEWTERLETVFPYREYAGPNLRLDTAPDVHLPPRDERPVKVTHVPKTAKTPRIIAQEPTCIMYNQQGLSRALTGKLEPSYKTVPSSFPTAITGSGWETSLSRVTFLGFRDQQPNQLLAQKGSFDGSLATLDLSEASDRVSNQLVLEMFRAWPSLSEAVQATRSRTAELPGGKKVRLSKFASMGSALTFPVEAMVFCTIAMLGVQDARKTRLTQRDLVRLRGMVRVYGDDIIVPTDCATAVVARLEAFGLKVNHRKSFWTGRFRESCGGDFYAGVRITPTRLGRTEPLSRRDVASILNWIEVSNSFHMQGLWTAAEYLAVKLRGVLGRLPVTDVETDALSLKSFVPGNRGELGWDKDTQRIKIRAWVPKYVIPRNEIDGDAALRKCLIGGLEDQVSSFEKAEHKDRRTWRHVVYPRTVDPEHLTRSGRPSSVHLKKRWVSI